MTPDKFRSLSFSERLDEINYLQSCKTPSKEIKSTLGISRSELSHLLRTDAKLDEHVKDLIRRNKLSLGHAKAIARLSGAQQDRLTRDVISKRWSVRRAEAEVRAALSGKTLSDNAYYEQLSETISDQVGQPVKIIPDGSKGCIQIEYFSFEDFDNIMARMKIQLPE